MNKVSEIIDGLLKHEITKEDAIEKIKKLTDRAKPKNAIEFDVTEVGLTTPHNHGYLKIYCRYGWDKICGKVEKGAKVRVTFMP